MLFGKDLMDKVLCGDKTVTRRLGDKSLYKIGNIYTTTDRSRWAKKGTPYRKCLVEIISNKQVALGSITDGDAKLEGFKNIDEFKEYWTKHLRFSFMPYLLVWRIEFKKSSSHCEGVKKYGE